MTQTAQTATAAQGAATAKKRGRPAGTSRDPKMIIKAVAEKAISANTRAIQALKRLQ